MPPRATTNAGIYLGRVTAINGNVADVVVDRLNPGYSYPARFPAELAGADTLPGGADSHTHGLRPLATDDEVAVGFFEGGRDELLVIFRLA